MIGDIFDSIRNGKYFVSFRVRDLDGELFFDGHDDFDRVERVQIQILLEARLGGYNRSIYLE